MPFPGDISGDLHAVGEAHSGDFTKRGVRLFGSSSGDLGADTTLERAREKNRPIFKNIEPPSESDCLVFRLGFYPAFFN